MTSAARTLGVILAGGQSRRMGGGDKCLADLGGRSLLARVIDRLAPQVDAMALSANGDPARFAGFGLLVVPDSIPGHPGPLAGILAGMDRAVAAGYDRVATVAADTPFFPEDLVMSLVARSGEAPVVLAASGDGALHPVFGLWSVELRERLRADIAAGTRKVRVWAEAQGAARVRFDAGEEPFFNVNTMEDLEIAGTRLAARGLSRTTR